MDVEQIMERVCELCHWPYVETDQERMAARCDACTIEADIRRLEKTE